MHSGIFFARWWAARPQVDGLGLPLKTVQVRMGHSTLAMTADLRSPVPLAGQCRGAGGRRSAADARLDWRSSFRDWAGEETRPTTFARPRWCISARINYQRGDFFEKRANLMLACAKHWEPPIMH